MHDTTQKRWTIIAHTENIIDKVLTYIALSIGGTELNPVVNTLVRNHGVLMGCLIALTFGMLGVHMAGKNKYSIMLVTTGLSFVLIWNLWILEGILW